MSAEATDYTAINRRRRWIFLSLATVVATLFLAGCVAAETALAQPMATPLQLVSVATPTSTLVATSTPTPTATSTATPESPGLLFSPELAALLSTLARRPPPPQTVITIVVTATPEPSPTHEPSPTPTPEPAPVTPSNPSTRPPAPTNVMDIAASLTMSPSATPTQTSTATPVPSATVPVVQNEPEPPTPTPKTAGVPTPGPDVEPVICDFADGDYLTIKGNINKYGEWLYYTPEDRHYAPTKIRTSEGERWFCTEREALAAGWIPYESNENRSRSRDDEDDSDDEVCEFSGTSKPVIKGNIRNGVKIYHTPDSQYYDQTQIKEEDGERWFCTEQEALDAGWRPPK